MDDERLMQLTVTYGARFGRGVKSGIIPIRASQCPDDHDVFKPSGRAARRDRQFRPHRKQAPSWTRGK